MKQCTFLWIWIISVTCPSSCPWCLCPHISIPYALLFSSLCPHILISYHFITSFSFLFFASLSPHTSILHFVFFPFSSFLSLLYSGARWRSWRHRSSEAGERPWDTHREGHRVPALQGQGFRLKSSLLTRGALRMLRTDTAYTPLSFFFSHIHLIFCA